MKDTKILLVWDGKKCVFKKYLLEEALKQTVKGEKHYLAEMYQGVL